MVNVNPIVYIVLSIYNGEKYFLEQLMSIYYQNYTDRFLIIVDDGSTDSSFQIAESFVDNYKLKNRVKIIKQDNKGTCKAVERGLIEVQKLNKGDNFVAYCDADDIWTRDKLEVQVKYMHEHKECDLCFHDLLIIDEDSKPIYGSLIKSMNKLGTIYPEDNSFFELSIGNHITTTEILFRASYIKEIIPIPNIGAKDWRTVLNFTLNNRNIQFINNRLGYYRRGHLSISRNLVSKGNIKNYKRNVEIFDNLEGKFINHTTVKYFKSYYLQRVKRGIGEYKKLRIGFNIIMHFPEIFFHMIKNIIKNLIIKK